jgi:hypothetical protein
MRGFHRLRFRGSGISLQRAPTAVGAPSNGRLALVLWLVTTLPGPCGGPGCPLARADLMRPGDECRPDRRLPAASPSLEPARPGPSSGRRDADVDDRAILDDDATDEEAPLSDGACLSGVLPTAGSFPLSTQLVPRIAGAIGGHAKGLPDLCRYRC